MDFRDVSLKKLRGNVIGTFVAVHGGKTETTIDILERAEHSGYNAIGYNHAGNVRDGKDLVANKRRSYPGKACSSIDEIWNDLKERTSILNASKAEHSPGNGYIKIGGIKHRSGLPILSVGVDEIQLFTLSEPAAQKTVDFLLWTKEQKLVVSVSGLEYDFRQREFGHIRSIFPYVDIRLYKKPVCKAVSDGTQCDKPALHSQRLWRMDLVQEEKLERIVDDVGLYDFALKNGEIVCGQYVPAPFFDKTVRIEGEGEGLHQVEYIPVCSSCSKLPYKEEVFKMHDALIEGKDFTKTLGDDDLRKRIVGFLVGEGWIRENGKGAGYEIIPSFRNRLGGYTPH